MVTKMLDPLEPEITRTGYTGMKLSTGYMDKKSSGIIPLYSEGRPDFSFDEVEDLFMSVVEEAGRDTETYLLKEDNEYVLKNREQTVMTEDPITAEELVYSGFELEKAVSEIYMDFTEEKIAKLTYKKKEEDTLSMFKPGRIVAEFYDNDEDIDLKDYFEKEFPEELFLDEDF